jgi:hypothetical protein
LVIPVLRYSFGIGNWHPEELQKLGQENEETAYHPWTALPKGRRRSLVCSQKTGWKGPDAVRSLHCKNNKTGGIYRQQRESTKTDCQNAPTQLQLSSVTDS